MSNNSNNNHSIQINHDHLRPHLRETLFITGSFVVAWSWDLLLYGMAHAWNHENPLRDPIGFGDEHQRAPKYLVVLVLEYLVVCGVAAWLSYTVRHNYHEHDWCAAALKAIEFFPAPFFSGKLMSYLSQFTRLSDLQQGLLNVLATAFAAFVANAADTNNSVTNRIELPASLHRFRPILAEALGFGLGVAWNVFLVNLFGPKDMDAGHIVGLFGYLMVVLLIAFRIAAEVGKKEDDDTTATQQQQTQNQQQQPISLLQRTFHMLSFAFNVVCAFTMVAFVSALLIDGWVGDVLCLVILLVFAVILSAGVASVDMEQTAAAQNSSRRTRRRQEQQQALVVDEEQNQQQIGFGTNCAVDALIFCPCIWCCCPWIPILWIMAGITPDIHVKERWQELIAFVLGLASSIQASGMLTTATNEISTALGICNSKYCNHPWLFIGLQAVLAILTTAILLPALGFVSDKVELDEIGTTTRTTSSNQQQGERQPLLRKVKKLFPKFARRKSSSEP